jgi:hypothetical protein
LVRPDWLADSHSLRPLSGSASLSRYDMFFSVRLSRGRLASTRISTSASDINRIPSGSVFLSQAEVHQSPDEF